MAIGAGKGIRSDQPPSSFIGFLLLPWVRHVDAGSYHACCATWVSHTSLSSSVTISACMEEITPTGIHAGSYCAGLAVNNWLKVLQQWFCPIGEPAIKIPKNKAASRDASHKIKNPRQMSKTAPKAIASTIKIRGSIWFIHAIKYLTKVLSTIATAFPRRHRSHQLSELQTGGTRKPKHRGRVRRWCAADKLFHC
ncbi:hypothetical protein J6590_067868 [Homalodisca vitripennis]|nr:hypothetical protein J6590_067868 [Homalodisca vitripennis]